MGKQIKFELKEINTKECIKDGIDDETRSYKYEDTLGDTEIKVKGEANANNLGLPTITLGDSILIEFGPKQMQQKLEGDLGINVTVEKTKKTKAKKK